MREIHISGQNPLRGEVWIQGSKNSALPMMAAALLCEGTVVLENCPRIEDVLCMENILRRLGAEVFRDGGSVSINCEKINSAEIPAEAAGKMRSSIVLLAPLLARRKEAKMHYPGGCTIGKRPIDLHLQVLRTMGAEICEDGESLQAFCPELKGREIVFPKSSVGASEQAILAGVSAEGVTCILGAAREPEIVHLCRFLRSMGAEITGEGSNRIEIHGGKILRGRAFLVPPDRIAAGTFLLAGAITRGSVTLLNAPLEEMEALLLVYRKIGGQYEAIGGILRTDSRQLCRAVEELQTEIYPGFPTDLQSLMLAVCTTLDGESKIVENIFEDRYKIVPQLQKMGADIQVCQKVAKIRGTGLTGARVKAQELRGGAALILAGLGAKGETFVENPFYIARGYEDLVEKLEMLGGKIENR